MSMVGLRDVLFVTPASAATGGGGGGEQQSVIPLISTATPYHLDDRNSVTAIHHHLWQQQQQQQQQMVPPPPFSSNYNSNPSPNLRKPTVMPLATMLESSTLPTGIIGGSGNVLLQSLSSSGTATCQDCGNQAKKDCTHRRCRTCCKSRGFDCSTHVKSTWVPAARRRESQLSGCNINIGSSGSTSTSKKPRLAGRNNVTGVTTAATTTSNTSNSNTTTSSTHHDESLPGQVSLPAVFKCVKVTSIDDGEGEYAYQAVVRIGGHIFKGFLYDQGLKDREESDLPNKNTTMPNLSELHLGGGSAAAGGAHGTNSNLLDGGGAVAAFGNNNIN